MKKRSTRKIWASMALTNKYKCISQVYRDVGDERLCNLISERYSSPCTLDLGHFSSGKMTPTCDKGLNIIQNVNQYLSHYVCLSGVAHRRASESAMSADAGPGTRMTSSLRGATLVPNLFIPHLHHCHHCLSSLLSFTFFFFARVRLAQRSV